MIIMVVKTVITFTVLFMNFIFVSTITVINGVIKITFILNVNAVNGI